MLRAAFTSASHGPALQGTHSKTAWVLRFPGAACPQAERRCDVYAAGTCSMCEARQPGLLSRCETGGVQQLASGQCRRDRHPAIDSDHAAVVRSGDRLADARACDMPVAGPIPGDEEGLHTRGHGPGAAEADLGQLRRLLALTRSVTARPPKLLLLDRPAPHEPGISAMRQQRHLLCGRRQQSEPRQTRNVNDPTDGNVNCTPSQVGVGVPPPG
jgi:hypothetical protein